MKSFFQRGGKQHSDDKEPRQFAGNRSNGDERESGNQLCDDLHSPPTLVFAFASLIWIFHGLIQSRIAGF
ncbi:hypothetical protein LZK76_18210 [Rhizobium leguminosarum]|nr:hypothetical protein LZK76_18210 [Rhizobium leguminosarum]